MSNTLALDLSTKRSGYAYRDKENKLRYGAVVESSSDVELRIFNMTQKIMKILKDNEYIDNIVVEEVRPTGTNDWTGKVLLWLQGHIAVAAFKLRGIKISYQPPTHWRKTLGIQGYRCKREEQKIKDIQFINEYLKINLKNDDDTADALGILLAYEKENKKEIIDGFEFG